MTVAFVAIFTSMMVSQILYVAPMHVNEEPGIIGKLTLGTILLDGLLLIYPLLVVLWFMRPSIRDALRGWK